MSRLFVRMTRQQCLLEGAAEHNNLKEREAEGGGGEQGDVAHARRKNAGWFVEWRGSIAPSRSEKRRTKPCEHGILERCSASNAPGFFFFRS